MSMFSGPLARLRAMRPSGTYDTQPIDPNGQSEPMGPAPMDWVQHLRRTAGLKPTAPTVDPDVYQPVQAENIQAPSGQQVYKRRDEINKQLFQLLSMGRFGDPELIRQSKALQGERGMLNDITAGEHAQGQLDRAARLRDAAKTAQSGWQDLDTADYKNMSSEDLDNYIAAKRAYNDNAIAAPLEGANRIESQAGMYQNDISKASLIRERLQKYMQQNADDELNTRGRALHDQQLQDQLATLPLKEARARQAMLDNAVREGASKADLAAIMASPEYIGTKMNREDAVANQNIAVGQEQLKALKRKNQQDAAAYDPALVADEKELKRLDVQANLIRARAANSQDQKSINFETAVADPEYKSIAQTASVLAAQLIGDGDNAVGAESLMSNVYRLNKYLAQLPPVDAQRLANNIRDQLATAGVKRLDTNYFTGSALNRHSETSQIYQRQMKSQQAIKALEYVLNKAGEPSQ